MTTLAERLEVAMKARPEMKPADLARACRVRPPSVSDWLTGKTKKLEGANLLLAAEFLDVDPWWLATGEGEMQRQRNAAAPSPDRRLGAHAQALAEAIREADIAGLPDEAFDALNETLRAFRNMVRQSNATFHMDSQARE